MANMHASNPYHHHPQSDTVERIQCFQSKIGQCGVLSVAKIHGQMRMGKGQHGKVDEFITNISDPDSKQILFTADGSFIPFINLQLMVLILTIL